jgi:hypothetical protein
VVTEADRARVEAGEDWSGENRYVVPVEVILTAPTPAAARARVSKTLGSLCRQDPYLAVLLGNAQESDVDLADLYAE